MSTKPWREVLDEIRQDFIDKNPEWVRNIYYPCKRKIVGWYWNIRSYPKRKYQRMTRGFDYREMWSLDVPIAKFVAPRVREFRDHYAIKFTPGSLVKFDEKTGMPLNDPEDSSHKEWLSIVDKICFSFEHLAKYEDWDLPMDDIESSDIIHGNSKWKKYRADNEEHLKIMSEGFELFGKFIGALWD